MVLKLFIAELVSCVPKSECVDIFITTAFY